MKTYIQALRKDAGITQTELAQKMGVSQAAIAMWEHAKRIPSLHTLHRLSTILNVPVTQLVDGEILEKIREDSRLQDIKTPPKDDAEWDLLINQANLSAKKMDEEIKDDIRRWIITVYPDLNEEGQKRVLEYMKDISQLPRYRRTHTEEGEGKDGDS